MGKQYLRYIPQAKFGVISSTRSNVVYDPSGKLAFLPSLEEVKLWDLKKGAEVATLSDPDIKHEVTALACNHDGRLLAAGYSNGTIRVWDLNTWALSTVFNGHKSEVTALHFDPCAARLVSGARDTDLIVWDILNETGLYRLRGHRNQITGVQFLGDKDFIISVSKDTLIKVWDLSMQHCIHTLVGHRSEILSMAIDLPRGRLITGSNEADMKLWSIDWDILDKGLMAADDVVLTLIGSIERSTKDKISQIALHSSGDYLACLGGDRAVELFKIRNFDEVKKKIKRRLLRLKEKNQLPEGVNPNDIKPSDVMGSDLITSFQVLRTESKIRSLDLHPTNLHVLMGLYSNSVEAHSFSPPSKENYKEPEVLYTLDQAGHRSEVRAVCLSASDEFLASCSNGLLKVWSVRKRSCISTMECGVAQCCVFLPGDRQILVGTKSGALELFDIASSSCVETIEAHKGTIWSIQVRPDKNGVITGSADKEVKFWDLDSKSIKAADGTGRMSQQLTLIHTRTLQMTEGVLCVRFSPDSRLLAVSLLDTTVKVFFVDTLKLFLSLYGHKLPVLSIDISSDSHLIATASGDKNIKLWGLEFGDCHKSLFAHQDSVMQVQFVPDTHYFFSASKDKMIKYWDGDKFENIMRLDGHHGEIWGMALSRYGSFVATGSNDRSIRLWERTDEPLFIEEEREKELEELFESTLIDKEQQTTNDEDVDEVGRPTTRSMDSLKAGERIFEALEIADKEAEDLELWKTLQAKSATPLSKPPRNPLLAAFNVSGERYVLDIVRKIRPADLEDAILTLPYPKMVSLLTYMSLWAKKSWSTPLVTRVLGFILQVYHSQITASRILRPVLESTRTHLRENLQREKDIMGFNLAGLKFLQRDLVASASADLLFTDNPELPKDPLELLAPKAVKRKIAS